VNGREKEKRDVRFGLPQVLRYDVVITKEETNAGDGEDDIYP
jgi:hypothetical protein